jgi:hypothetical protein
MGKSEFLKISVLTARRCVKNRYKYHRLDKSRLGEAEVRNVMAKILEEKKIYYGIEVATQERFQKQVKKTTRRALIDLAIYDGPDTKLPSIIVEFKRSQPVLYNIIKDFKKMMAEPNDIKGACFFHILPQSEGAKEGKESMGRISRARNEIIKKYEEAYKEAKVRQCVDKWFMLFILDGSRDEYYYVEKESICRLDGLGTGEWKALKSRQRKDDY